MLATKEKRIRRHKRVRAKISGSARIPRLSVFKSSLHIYAQLIDDEKGKTLLAAQDKEIGKSNKKPSTAKKSEGADHLKGKEAVAYQVGMALAKKALENKIEKVVFDRGGFQFHGRIKALADGARAGGLNF